MSDKNGADTGCALFVITVKGFVGSYGAAVKCLEAPACPPGYREDVWERLKKWSEKTLKACEECEKCTSIHEALWIIGKEGYGFKVNIRDIPLEQEAVEISEALGLGIYDLESAGVEVRLCTADIPDGSVCIGFAKKGRDKILVNGDEISYLNRPPSE